jgi:outer membrane protein OmpA-like peptidoglycan-associated protein
MRLPVAISLLAFPLVCAVLPAAAQSNPSADQIIQSLKPSGDLVGGKTRGIRLVNPDATPTTPQAAPAKSPAKTAAAMPAESGAPSLNLTVEFLTGSATLTPQARRTLDQLGRALASPDLSAYRFRIEGHTDTVGSPDANRALSQRRAEAVADYLEKSYGVTATRLEAVGMGQEGLLVPTPPQTPNAQNRRVKVVNLGA